VHGVLRDVLAARAGRRRQERRDGGGDRADGSSQLTANGYPVYTYVGDHARGQANGQGTNLSGGRWWVVSPSGARVTMTPSPSAGSSSSGGGGY
jgi:Secreted repeat of unknown function